MTIENAEDQRGRHTKYLPYAFTEQGVAMLSAVLRSEKAIKVSIEIMNAFVQMRHYLYRNIAIASRLDAVENKVDAKFLEHETNFRKIDENFSKIFHVLDSSPQKAKEGVFFKGQIFDAYAFFQDIIKTAKKEIVLIDGYVDLSVLERLSVKQKNVSVKIYTHPKAELQQIDVDQFNQQYPTATMDYTKKMTRQIASHKSTCYKQAWRYNQFRTQTHHSLLTVVVTTSVSALLYGVLYINFQVKELSFKDNTSIA